MRRLILIVIAAGLLSCNVLGNKDAKRHEARTVEVAVIKADYTRTNDKYSYIGRVEPSKNSLIHAQATGELSMLNIRKGQHVMKGQVLAVIDSEPVKSAYAVAKANLDMAQDGYGRVMEVYSSGGVSEQKVVEIRSQLEKASASERAARKALENCLVRAPYDGIINEVVAEEGTQVAMLSVIARILDIRDVEITFPVPETEIGSMSCGQNAEVFIPSTGRTLNARIAVIGHTASPMSHTYDCTLAPRTEAGLLPGMVCRVTILSHGRTGMEIPSQAVMTDMNGRYVWVVNDGMVAKRYVHIDGYSTDGVIVTKGLSSGDEVIVEGRRKVSEGMKVKTVAR